MFFIIFISFCSVVSSSNLIQDQHSVEYILSEIQNLKTKQNVCDAQVSSLQGTVSEFKEIANQLETRNDMLEQEISSLRHALLLEAEDGTDQNDDDKANQSNHGGSHQYRRMATAHIAFTAGVSVTDLTHLGDHHTIIFDRAITNIGNAYSTKSGIFQAPLKGAYVITLTMMVSSRLSEYLDIVVDGNRINDVLADASSVDDYMSTTKQLILDLNRGSEVWIRTSPVHNHGEIHGKMHTLFSGFLLFETV